MARKYNVTRTIKATVATCMCVDVPTREMVTLDFTVGGVFKEEKELVKALKKAHESETFKIVAVLETNVKEALYGMTEETFMENAVLLKGGEQEEQTEE